MMMMKCQFDWCRNAMYTEWRAIQQYVPCKFKQGLNSIHVSIYKVIQPPLNKVGVYCVGPLHGVKRYVIVRYVTV